MWMTPDHINWLGSNNTNNKWTLCEIISMIKIIIIIMLVIVIMIIQIMMTTTVMKIIEFIFRLQHITMNIVIYLDGCYQVEGEPEGNKNHTAGAT